MKYMELGRNIRTARKRKGYTQAQIAEIMGYSVQHISHVENGITRMSIEFIVCLANCLEVSLDELFRESLTYNKEYEHYQINSFLDNSTNEERKMLIKSLSLVKSNIEDIIELAGR